MLFDDLSDISVVHVERLSTSCLTPSRSWWWSWLAILTTSITSCQPRNHGSRNDVPGYKLSTELSRGTKVGQPTVEDRPMKIAKRDEAGLGGVRDLETEGCP